MASVEQKTLQKNKFKKMAFIEQKILPKNKFKKRMLFTSFIISQLNYCPIVWMCHGRGLSNKINHIHEKALRTVYRDKKSSFETLLTRHKSMSIYVKNLQHLTTELFKMKNDFSLEIMKEIFVFIKKMKLTI